MVTFESAGGTAPLNADALAIRAYRSIIEDSDDAIVALTLDGTVMSWNHAARRLFGWGSSEIIGRAITCLLPPERAGEEAALIGRIRNGERVRHFMTLRRTRDGRDLPVSVSISPLYDDDRRMLGVSQILRDISRDILQVRLERQYEAIVQSCDDAIIGKTLDGIVTSWNPAAERILGYSAREIIGHSIGAIIPVERNAEEAAIVERISRGERVDHMQTQRLHKDGRLIDVTITVSPIRDAAGAIVGASKMLRDITVDKQLQERLRMIGVVFAEASDGVAIVDAEGRVTDANDALARITGHPRAELLGSNLTALGAGRAYAHGIERLLDLARRQGTAQGEVWSRRRDGSALGAWLSITAIKDAHARPSHYVALLGDITELRREQEKNAYLAHHDPLTGLPNRTQLLERLRRATGPEATGSAALFYLDLDGFKAINDRYGGETGDQLLRSIGERLRAGLPADAVVARVAGDEFAVLLDPGGDALPVWGGKLAGLVAQPLPLPGLGADVVVELSASIGATAHPADDGDPEQLMRHADHAMGQVKAEGGDGFRAFDPRARLGEIQLRTRIEHVRRAIRGRQLVVHYQPQVHMPSGQVSGAEALVRWAHPQHGLLLPAEFVGLIENSSLICDLTDWLLGEALTQIETWAKLGQPLRIGVNIAPYQLRNAEFAAVLRRALEQHPGADPGLLALEIVESSALGDGRIAARNIAAGHDMGVSFAVDDFGTGFSSLTYLKQLDADSIKIDQSFVRGMLRDEDDGAIVRGIIGLARAFGKSVVAEGVETIEQGQALIALGCEHAQGHAIARPMSPAAFVAWLRDWHPDARWRAPG